MVAVKAGDVDNVLRKPDPRTVVFLVYGPDAGLVSERASLLAQRSVADKDDPFQLVRLDGDELAGDPLKLADEANTIGLFGGRRAIWIKPTTRNLVPALTPVLATPPIDAVIVVEAGDLARSSPLRTLCERSGHAAALPCYADDSQHVGRLVETMLREAGLGITRQARETLVSLLGADRIATRNEIAKLALYAHGQTEVTVEDIEETVGDVSALAADGVIDAAFTGDLAGLDLAMARLSAEGLDSGTLVGFALRHALMLAGARAAIDAGKPLPTIVNGLRGLHFKRKTTVERQIRAWTAGMLDRAIRDCGEAVAGTRKQAAIAGPIAQKSLWSIALAARRAAR